MTRRLTTIRPGILSAAVAASGCGRLAAGPGPATPPPTGKLRRITADDRAVLYFGTWIAEGGRKPRRKPPPRRPEFEEITVVLEGLLRVEHETGVLDVTAGQAVVCAPGEWIRYSCPEPEGAHYIAVCLPAFSPDTVHRDED